MLRNGRVRGVIVGLQRQEQVSAEPAATGPAANRGVQLERPWNGRLRLLARAAVVNTGRSERVSETFDQVRAKTWRLLDPKA